MKTVLRLILASLLCALAPARADYLWVLGTSTSVSGGTTTLTTPLGFWYANGTTTSLSLPPNGTLVITSGNVATATALATARTINGVNFDGTGNIVITAAGPTLTGTSLSTAIIGSSLASVGTLTAGSASTGFTINAGNVTWAGNVPAVNIATLNQNTTGYSASTSGNALTATTLQTARNINGVAFDGSGAITVAAAANTLTTNTLASGVTASSLLTAGGGTFGTAAFTAASAYIAAGTNALTVSVSGQAVSNVAQAGTFAFAAGLNTTLTLSGSTLTISNTTNSFTLGTSTETLGSTITALAGLTSVSMSGPFNIGAAVLTLSNSTTLAGAGGTLSLSANTFTLSGGGTLNLNGNTHTISGSNTISGSGMLYLGANTLSMSGSGTLSLGGFNLTVPATGTAGLLGTAQTWSQLNTFSSTVTHTGALNTRTFSVGATGTTFQGLIAYSISASSGLATVTNAAITATSVPTWANTKASGTVTQSPQFTMNAGSMSFTVTSGDTSTYSGFIFVK